MKRLAATLIFFTRLPLWRVVNVDQSFYRRVVELWPVAGWVTALVTAGALYCASLLFTPLVSVVIAFAVRVLFTGAMHEDGLADFFDGFGGGLDRESILRIMKDSHIGTYGTLGLILYFGLLCVTVAQLPVEYACLMILAGDPWSKYCASGIINTLPYCRTAETAKNRTVYPKMDVWSRILAFLFGALPLVWILGWPMLAAVVPLFVSRLLFRYMRYKIGGYTGDCCGATFLLSELSFYLAVSAIFRWN